MSESTPGRIAVRIPNWLGDAVMALPALAALRGANPSAHITFAGLSSVLPIFEEMSAPDLKVGPTAAIQPTPGAAVGRPDHLLTVDRTTEVAALRDGRFDAIVLLTNSFRAAWTSRRAGIPERWGYRTGGRGLLLTRAVAVPSGERHQSEYYLELVRGLGISAPALAPHIDVGERSRTRAAALLAQHGIPPGAALVGFAPGAAYGHAKRWPPSRVAEVVARLVRERGAACVLVGAAGDREAGREIESSLPSDLAVANLIGRTDLRVLMGVMTACRAFVSNDSGAMHLAAAVGVPVTALFGPTKERVTAPLGDHDVLLHQVFCRPCMLRDCPIDHRCMKRITVDEVFTSVVRRLDPPA